VETGISTAVLKGANAPKNPGPSNGQQVGNAPTDELETEDGFVSGARAFVYTESGKVGYQRVNAHSDCAVRREPARTETNSLSANGRRNG
jgi:hypothetical protein